jgi:hypothetical protein
VHLDVEPVGLVEDRLEAVRSLGAGDLHSVVRAVGEALLGGRQLVQVGRRQTELLEPVADAHSAEGASRYTVFHCVSEVSAGPFITAASAAP